jgi:ABC-type anion transport system duplicated permease subunit
MLLIQKKKSRIVVKMKKANKILLIVIAVLFIGIATYVGLKSWSGFVVPNLEKISQFPLPILFGFALLAGAISFFAPCSI